MECGDYSAYEKAGLVVWHLAHGEGMRMSDIEALTGLSQSGAYNMMAHLSRVLPLRSISGVWEVVFEASFT